MRPHGSAKQLEARRQRALELLESETHPQNVANQLGVTRRSVDDWRKKYREHGEEAILAKPHPGRACFLSDEQLKIFANVWLRALSARALNQNFGRALAFSH